MPPCLTASQAVQLGRANLCSQCCIDCMQHGRQQCVGNQASGQDVRGQSGCNAAHRLVTRRQPGVLVAGGGALAREDRPGNYARPEDIPEALLRFPRHPLQHVPALRGDRLDQAPQAWQSFWEAEVAGLRRGEVHHRHAARQGPLQRGPEQTAGKSAPRSLSLHTCTCN